MATGAYSSYAYGTSFAFSSIGFNKYGSIISFYSLALGLFIKLAASWMSSVSSFKASGTGTRFSKSEYPY